MNILYSAILLDINVSIFLSLEGSKLYFNCIMLHIYAELYSKSSTFKHLFNGAFKSHPTHATNNLYT